MPDQKPQTFLDQKEPAAEQDSAEFLRPRKKSYWWIWLIVIVLVIGGGITYSQLTKPVESPYITEQSQKTDIKQSVEVTGSIEPADEIDLNFKTVGTVQNVNSKIGDPVKKGDIIASLDTSELLSQLAQSQASVAVAQAQLEKTLEGSRPEEIDVAQTNVNNAQTSYNSAVNNYNLTKELIDNDLKQAQTSINNTQKLLNEAEKNLTNIQNQSDQNISNTITTILNQINIALISEKSVETNINQIFDNNGWNKTFDNLDSFLTTQINNNRYQMKFTRQDAENSYNLAISSKSITDTQTAITDTLTHLDGITQILNNSRQILYMENAEYFFSSTDLSNLKSRQTSNEATHNSNLTSAQNQQNSIETTTVSNQVAIDNANNQIINYQNQLQSAEESYQSIEVNGKQKLQTAQDQIDSTSDQLTIQQKQLALTKAGPTAGTIAVARAQVSQAQAAVKIIETQIQNQQIIAPIDGIITQVNVSEGESSNSANPVIQIQSDAKYEINADIAETDIDKISIGNQTVIDFDALTKDDIFSGTVVKIEPAATVIQGVVYYKTKVILDSQDSRIKPGMTANIEVITAETKNVIAVSNQAVKKENGSYYVEILTDEKNQTVKKQTVEIGLKGNTHTEIKSGLSGGENVIILTNK